MQTGKIYKNKLSTFEDEPSPHQLSVEVKQIMRARSQPGFNFNNSSLRPENAETMPLGTLKSQRDKIVPEFHQNSYLNVCNKQILEDHLLNAEMGPSPADQILEY
jgi:hypothetical protein